MICTWPRARAPTARDPGPSRFWGPGLGPRPFAYDFCILCKWSSHGCTLLYFCTLFGMLANEFTLLHMFCILFARFLSHDCHIMFTLFHMIVTFPVILCHSIFTFWFICEIWPTVGPNFFTMLWSAYANIYTYIYIYIYIYIYGRVAKDRVLNP